MGVSGAVGTLTTHRKKPEEPRHWRTRRDDFEPVWPKILAWLETDPDATAKSLLDRLVVEDPHEFQPRQLRTLQRRVAEWRRAQASALIGRPDEAPDGQ